MAQANMFTLRRRKDGFAIKAGIHLDFDQVKDDKGNALGTVQGLLMGHRFSRNPKGRILVPLDHTHRPGLSNDGGYVYRGSFVSGEGDQGPLLRSFDPELDKEGTAYLRVQTGFDPNVRGGASTELARMQTALGLQPGMPFQAYKHGSVALEAGPATHQVLGLGADATAEEAEEVWRAIGRVMGLGVPPYTDTLWRLSPVNAAVLGGDIDGKLQLVVNERGTVRTDDGKALRDMFESMLPSRKKAA